MATRFSRPRWPALAALAACALLLALLAAACDETTSRGKYDSMIQGITILDGAGLHAIDQSINTDKKVPPTAQTTYQHLEAITRLTAWPSGDLTQESNKMADIFRDAANALNTDRPDMAQAGKLANEAHEAEHDFSHKIWDYLQGKAGVKVSANEGSATD